jgi:predicted enzyme related to lactoylglutathione lyase
MPNPFVHVELNAADVAKAKAFYSQLFQWKLGDVPNPAIAGGSYTMIEVGSGTGGGIIQQIPGGPSGWLAYVEVEDIRGTMEKAVSLGGKIMKDVTEVPSMGWFSFIQDPNGAVLGLWKSK